MTPRLAALMTLPPLVWAGNAVVGRMLVGHVPSQSLNLLRWGFALLFLLPLGWRALATPAARAAVWARRWHLALLGVLGITAYNAFQYLALTTTTALNATLIAASGPVWMLLFGLLLFHERPQRRQWFSCALSLAGVLIVVGRGDPAVLAHVQLVPGDWLMLLAVACWSLYSWLLARPPASMRAPQRPDWNWAEFLLVQVLFGVCFAAMGAGAEQLVAPQPIHWSPWVLAAVVYVALGPSILAYWCWGIGVARTGPAMAGFFANLTPLFAAVFSAALLGEHPKPYHALAFALIVAGIAVNARGRARTGQ
jgi:drug/metabolite transporter (DMT)-like permease